MNLIADNIGQKHAIQLHQHVSQTDLALRVKLNFPFTTAHFDKTNHVSLTFR